MGATDATSPPLFRGSQACCFFGTVIAESSAANIVWFVTFVTFVKFVNETWQRAGLSPKMSGRPKA